MFILYAGLRMLPRPCGIAFQFVWCIQLIKRQRRPPQEGNYGTFITDLPFDRPTDRLRDCRKRTQSGTSRDTPARNDATLSSSSTVLTTTRTPIHGTANPAGVGGQLTDGEGTRVNTRRRKLPSAWILEQSLRRVCRPIIGFQWQLRVFL